MNNCKLFLGVLYMLITFSLHAQKPVADAGEDIIEMNETGSTTVMLDASGSTDNGTIEKYYWIRNNTDTISTDIQFSLEVNEPSTKITLRIVDDQGEKDADVKYIFIGHPSNYGHNRVSIRGGNQDIFASGMNIAWNKFAKDLEDFDLDAQNYFKEVMDSISGNGGNVLRWWLHTNGLISPIFDDQGNVTGIDHENLNIMKQVLDMAFERGIMINMTLWSFDMLQSQGQNRLFTRALLEDQVKTQTYIDNALVPMLEVLGTHPAVFTWEIFNEPEGMASDISTAGWADEKTKMVNIQRFVNLTAGAIHRTSPTAQVSNGAWSFKVLTDINDHQNYYSDEALINVGGDSLGTLDFYQVHYYAEHMGNDISPFHRPASHWGLDKPIVIGEFRSTGITNKADPNLTTKEAYQRAIELGYAGAISWSWTDSDLKLFTQTMGKALSYVQETYPAAVMLNDEGIVLKRVPKTIASIPSLRKVTGTSIDFNNYIDLNEIFSDEDGDSLGFIISKNSNANIVTAGVSSGSKLDLELIDGETGTANISVTATDTDGWTVNSSFFVMVKSMEGQEDNLAFFKPVIASSVDNTENADILLNDGDLSTRWSSAYNDNEWIYIDFEKEVDINYLRLSWEVAYASVYEIQSSNDAENWVTEYVEEESNGGFDVITFNKTFSTRYLKILAKERATQWGVSIYELIAKNISANKAPTVIKEVEDYVVNATEVKALDNFLKFKDIFTDEEDPDALTFHIQSSNEQVVTVDLTSEKDGISLDFAQNLPGKAIISITATDPFGASVSSSFTIEVIDDIVGITKSDIHLLVFPNPASDIVSLEAYEGRYSLYEAKIYNMEGHLILSKIFDPHEDGQINISELLTGIYVLEVHTSIGIEQIKLIKQ